MSVAVKVVMCQGETLLLANASGLRCPSHDVVWTRKHDREQMGGTKSTVCLVQKKFD